MNSVMSENSDPIRRPRGFARHVIRFAISALAILGVVMISKMPKPQSDVEQTVSPPVNVSVRQIKAASEVPDSFTLPAVVEPNRVTTISAEISGRIESVDCKKGKTVCANDLLLTLNSDLLVPQYNTAKAQYERDRLEWERMKDLVQKKATAQKDLDNAATKMTISKAALDQLGVTLDRSRILSPSDGVINDLTVERGEYVGPGATVAQLVDTTTIKVVVDLPEKDVSFFSLGQPADILVPLRSTEKAFSGTITFISEVADRQTRSTRMEITLSNTDRVLHSGQIVQVRLTRQIFRNAIFIPLRTVIPMESSKAVYVVEDNHAVRRDVTLGVIKGDRIQILDGLNPGDQLIVEGHRFVAPGLKVTVIPEKP